MSLDWVAGWIIVLYPGLPWQFPLIFTVRRKNSLKIIWTFFWKLVILKNAIVHIPQKLYNFLIIFLWKITKKCVTYWGQLCKIKTKWNKIFFNKYNIIKNYCKKSLKWRLEETIWYNLKRQDQTPKIQFRTPINKTQKRWQTFLIANIRFKNWRSSFLKPDSDEMCTQIHIV